MFIESSLATANAARQSFVLTAFRETVQNLFRQPRAVLAHDERLPVTGCFLDRVNAISSPLRSASCASSCDASHMRV